MDEIEDLKEDNIKETDTMIGEDNNISEEFENTLDIEQYEEGLNRNNVIKDIDENENIQESSYGTNQLLLESSLGTNQLLLNESIEEDNGFEQYSNNVIHDHVNDDTAINDNNDINENIDINQQNNHKKMKLNIKNIKKPLTKWILFSNEYRSSISKEMIDYNNSNNTSMKGMSIGDSAKIIAEKYKILSIEDNERLELLVKQDKERYNNEIANAPYEEENESDRNKSLHSVTDALSLTNIILPMARIRKTAKLDPNVKAISKDGMLLITKATELFVGYLARKCAYTISLRGAKTVKDTDVIQTIFMHQNLNFLRIDFPKKKVILSNHHHDKSINQLKTIININNETTITNSSSSNNKKISTYFVKDKQITNENDIATINNNNDNLVEVLSSRSSELIYSGIDDHNLE